MKTRALLVGVALFSIACATKSYVQKSLDPLNGKLNVVAAQTSQQGKAIAQTEQALDQARQSIDATKETLSQHQTSISAANERALSADSRAGDALSHAEIAGNRADEARKEASRAAQDVLDLKNAIGGIDDYQPVFNTALYFKVNSDSLDGTAKHQLDDLASALSQLKHYLVAVKGFTDQTGSNEYNNALSRKRAETAIKYLVEQYNVPLYRLHLIGLGRDRLVDDAANAVSRARNRRVEISLYSADPTAADALAHSGLPRLVK